MADDQLPNRQPIATHPRRISAALQRQLDALPKRFPGHTITRGTPERGQPAYTLAFDGTPGEASKQAAAAFREICGSPAGRKPKALADGLPERITLRVSKDAKAKFERLGRQAGNILRQALADAPEPK